MSLSLVAGVCSEVIAMTPISAFVALAQRRPRAAAQVAASSNGVPACAGTTVFRVRHETSHVDLLP